MRTTRPRPRKHLVVRPVALGLALLIAGGAGIGDAEAAIAQEDSAEAAALELEATLEQASGGDVTVARDQATGFVTFVGTEAGRPVASTEAAGTPEAAADAFVGRFGSRFGENGPSALERTSTETRVGGGATVHYRQEIASVPVLGGELQVQLDAEGDVLSALGELAPSTTDSAAPTVTAERATAEALTAVARAHEVDAATLVPSPAETWWYAPELLGGPVELPGTRLVWRIEIAGPSNGEPIDELVLVDATTGTVVLHFNQIAHARSRRVCDATNNPANSAPCVFPFAAARTEGQAATGNVDVDKAYDYSGHTYDFFFSRFGRDSIDGNGMAVRSTVRFCPVGETCPYTNAFWDGAQMYYGAGYAAADDVVGHELTHGVTEHESGLFYYFQSGAINEALSDIFGELIDLTNGAGNDAASVRWLLGEDIPGGAVRNMANPGQFGQPRVMNDVNYAWGNDDQGGVHTNSGVANKAASLLVDGGTLSGRTVPALGITKTARIFYEAVTTLLTSGSDYADLAFALHQACNNVIGVNGITSADCSGVQQATAAVRMTTDPPQAPAPSAPGCTGGNIASTVFSDDLENPAAGRWSVSGTGAATWAYPQNPNEYIGFDATYATSGDTNFFAPGVNQTTDTRIARTAGVTLPAGSILLFNHAYQYESGFDGGTVEYSTNGGLSWVDAGPLFSHNGYNSNATGVPAFSGVSNGYRTSRVDLSSLTGQNVRIRFRSRTDNAGTNGYGWFVDDVRILSCQPPTGRPDAHLRTGTTGAYVGDNIYNTTGANQNRSANIGHLGTANFYARIQSDGNVSERITVSGTGTTTHYTVAYFSGSTNITSQVVAGTYRTASIAPGQSAVIRVAVTARSTAFVSSLTNVTVTAKSTTTTANRDVVKATVRRI